MRCVTASVALGVVGILIVPDEDDGVSGVVTAVVDEGVDGVHGGNVRSLWVVVGVDGHITTGPTALGIKCVGRAVIEAPEVTMGDVTADDDSSNGVTGAETIALGRGVHMRLTMLPTSAVDAEGEMPAAAERHCGMAVSSKGDPRPPAIILVSLMQSHMHQRSKLTHSHWLISGRHHREGVLFWCSWRYRLGT